MKVVFPDEQPHTIDYKHIFVEVVGLSECYHRPTYLRSKLAEALGQAVKKFFPAAKVAVVIQRFNHRADGYWEG